MSELTEKSDVLTQTTTVQQIQHTQTTLDTNSGPYNITLKAIPHTQLKVSTKIQ